MEPVVNGRVVESQRLRGDGRTRELHFETKIDRSSWIALRIPKSSHTNPIFVIVDDKPIRASRRSAEWSLAAVDQCWTQKAPRIRESEKQAAREAYDHARETYRRLIRESPVP